MDGEMFELMIDIFEYTEEHWEMGEVETVFSHGSGEATREWKFVGAAKPLGTENLWERRSRSEAKICSEQTAMGFD